MNGILIKGLKMPDDDILRIEICPNGQVNRIIGWAITEQNKGKAIEIKDVDAFLREYLTETVRYRAMVRGEFVEIEIPLKEILRPLHEMPTIIESTGDVEVDE